MYQPHSREASCSGAVDTKWRPWIFWGYFFVVVLLGSLLLIHYHGQVAMVL
jgi:hypothetical protein